MYRGGCAAARDAFAIFQQGARPNDLPEGFLRRDGRHFGNVWRIGNIGLIAPDLRSNRTQRRVMDDVGWADFRAGLARLEGCRHPLRVPSVPAVNADLSAIERLRPIMPGYPSHPHALRAQCNDP